MCSCLWEKISKIKYLLDRSIMCQIKMQEENNSNKSKRKSRVLVVENFKRLNKNKKKRLIIFV